MSFQKVRRETTSVEFVQWQEYLFEEVNDFNPLYHYLAQICMVIHQGQVKKGVKVRLGDFLLKFKRKIQRLLPEYHLTPEQRAERSRSIWMGATGYTKLQKEKERKEKLEKKKKKKWLRLSSKG